MRHAAAVRAWARVPSAPVRPSRAARRGGAYSIGAPVSGSVSGSGTASLSAYGATVDSAGNLNLDGLVSAAVDALDSHAPQALKDIGDAITNAVAVYGSTVEGASAAATFLAVDAATTAAIVSAATVVGVVFAVTALLLAIDPAKAGPGCCGTDVSKHYGTCSPAEFDWYGPNGPGSAGNQGGQWAGDHWTNPSAQTKWKPANAWEAAIGAFIMGKFNALSDCWTYLAPQWYVATLAAAVAAWNRAHFATSTTKVTRAVNWTMPGGTFGGKAQPPIPNQPQSWADPIAIALNNASLNYRKDSSGNILVSGAKVRPFAFASFTVNTGPAIPAALHLAPFKVAPPKPPPAVPKLPPLHLAPPPAPARAATAAPAVLPAAAAPKSSGLGTGGTVLAVAAAAASAAALAWAARTGRLAALARKVRP